jgi:mono/diheme cytochrome c family protein
LLAASPGETLAVARPALSAQAALGDAAFQRLCGECHGPNAGGGNRGPPLVHRVYAPNHHADFSFLRAMTAGTRAHHWRFGDMPPRPAANEDEARAIVRFLREMQRANGIE